MSSETVDGEANDLRKRIDELATQLVLEGPGGDFARALAELSERAGESGYPATARIGRALAERANADTCSVRETEDALSRGIADLQQALWEEARRRPAAPAVLAQEAPAPPLNSLAQDPELVGDFILESREHLASIESRMLVLEQNPADAEAIHSVFRGFHTIKGLAGFLEFADIQQVAHEVETLLDLARDSRLAITPAVVDVVLESADSLKQAIAGAEAALAAGTSRAARDYSGLLSRIRTVMTGENQTAGTPRAEAQAERPEVPAPDTAAPEARSARPADSFSVRVDTSRLDYLMDMVGEMVIAQSLIRHNPNLASIQDSRLQSDLAQLARTTNEVQRTAMALRMVPVGQLFQRTARLVRDLSRKAGKRVELETSGEDTELDKTIAEELSDPLMHMVRNAIDHGLEPPAARAAAGKSPTAHVRLAAYHQGGQIVVNISDDGRGLDREKILKKARQNGLVQEGAQLSEGEIFQLIFEPGFSTADQVSEISGRGVGMDVVRRHVQNLRGRIEIESKEGQGTTFLLKLPLTLAIIEGLIVVVGTNRYVVPIFTVREMFRPTADVLSTVQGRGEMALVRGRLLPVVRLYRRFGVKPQSEDPCQGLLVMAECQDRQFCILVDGVLGKQEVVIKSLGESLKNVTGIAGGAILGDGRVGLILDIEGLLRGNSHE